MEDGLISADPTARIKNLKHQKPIPDPFTVEERDRILSRLKEKHPIAAWAYFEFAFSTAYAQAS